MSIRRLEAHGNRLAPLCLSVFGPLFILFASVYWVLRALFQHGVFIWRLRPADGRRACPGGPASYRLAAGGGRAYRGGYALPLCGPGTHPVSEKGAPSERGMPDAAASFWATVAGHTQAPGKAGGLRKPWKGSLPASLSRGTEYSVSCITCPAPRKWGSSRCVLHLFGIEYHLASPGTDSESLFTLPGTAGECRFAKASRHNHRLSRWLELAL